MSLRSELSNEAVDFLKEECSRLQALYAQEQDMIQSVFNFYMTFIGTAVGALVVLLQVTSLEALQTRLTVALLMLLALVISGVYLSAISGRYAHATRYSRALDELRRHLITRLNVPMPPLYDAFLSPAKVPARPSRFSLRAGWFSWLFPTGTYQLFIALVAALTLAAFGALLLSLGDLDTVTITTAFCVIAVVALTLCNAYSRLTIRRFGRQLHVAVHTGQETSVWAGRS